MTPFEYVGHWWLPDQPDEKFVGTLTYDGVSRPELKLLGSLRPLLQAAATDEPFTPEIILGFSSDGKAITLYSCAEASYVHSHPGLSRVTYVAAYAIVGGHFESRDRLRFEKFWITYDRLIEWTRLTGLKSDVEAEEGTISRVTVRWAKPRPYAVTVAGWKVKFSYGFHQSGDRLRNLNLEHHVAVEAVPLGPQLIDEFLSGFAYHYRNFITLGLGTPTYPIHFSAQPIANEDQTAEQSIVRIYHSIQRRDLQKGTLHPFDLLFGFWDIADVYESCLERWFSRADLLRPVYGLYFGTLYNDPGSLEPQFLSLAQALESYHRRVVGGSLLGPERFERVKQALLSTLGRDLTITAEARESYERKLDYFDEVSLRRRIKDLVRGFGRTASLLIPRAGGFADRVSNTRNYLTHYDESLSGSSATGQDLWILTQQMRFLLELCFLREIGLSEEQILEIASNHQRYLFLRTRLAELSRL